MTSAETAVERVSAAMGGEGPARSRNSAPLRLRLRLQPAGGPGTKVRREAHRDARRAAFLDRAISELRPAARHRFATSPARSTPVKPAAALATGSPSVRLREAFRQPGLRPLHRQVSRWTGDAVVTPTTSEMIECP